MDIHGGFELSVNDNRPMYLQIMDQIKLRIAIGDWPPGTKLPSIRELAVASKVSVITVKRAYLELERAQVILTQRGKGSFVSDGTDAVREACLKDMEAHLGKAVRLAAMQGLSLAELQQRLVKIHGTICQENLDD